MTTACPYLVCLLSLMPGLISIGYTQKKHDPARAATKFSKRNKTYDIHYDGHTGKHGHNALDLFKFMSREGSDGGSGGQGPCLQARISAIPTGDSIILAIDITPDGAVQTDHYYVNPRHGKIFIFANGGEGGWGGDGSDVIFTRGYSGGNGGQGGIIDMMYDSSALAFVDCPCIIARNLGGKGGDGGSGGRKDNQDAGPGQEGLWGDAGPPICKKDMNGNTLRILPSANR